MFSTYFKKIKHNIKLSNIGLYKLHLLRNYYRSKANIYKNAEVKEILICGLNRSGSTMIYNIVQLMVNIPNENLDVYIKNDFDYVELLKKFKKEQTALFKIHHFSFLAKKRIETGKAIAIFSHRDTRDVCVSLIQKGWLDVKTYFSKKVYKYHYYNSILYTSVKGVNTITYKQLMETKREAIYHIAKILAKDITEAEVEAILLKTDIENTKKIIKASDSANYSISSQLHANHISDGKSNKYLSFFSTKELEKLNKKNQKFLKYFKYIR